MANIPKLLLTLFIWAGCVTISMFAITNAGLGGITGGVVVVALVPVIIAQMVTAILWMDSLSFGSRAAAADKQKRAEPVSRMALLQELMTPDELEAFKDTLRERMLRDSARLQDGELADDAESLTELLRDDRPRR